MSDRWQLDLRVPIGQGQTRYQYLVMQFTREEEITAELNMSECVYHLSIVTHIFINIP
jgi:hypothetical protein